jgi:MFS-type transporter involved in bile tolerance (Atg22 family)
LRPYSALHAHAEQDLNRAALSATTHCLTGCAIGEVLGMAIAEAFGWSNAVQIVLAIALAFVFGYALTMWPVLKVGLSFRQATGVALAADTVSIVIMEAVDNAFVLLVPGAIDAGLGDAKFWWSIGLGFAIAFGPAWAANRWLLARGKGHAVAHAYHDH